MPLMDSALWPLSVDTNLTVSPGAIFTKAGSNTITAPSPPLLRSLTSTSAARAPPARTRTRTAAAAASIATFFMIPVSFPFPGTCARDLPGSRVPRPVPPILRQRNLRTEFWAKRFGLAVEACFGRGYHPQQTGTRISMASVDRSLVANLPMFAGLTPAEQDELLQEARSTRYPKGTAVFDQGME